jgi:hypothetical protein
LAVVTIRSWFKRVFGRKPIICPACSAPAGVLLSRTVEGVEFIEILVSGWAGHSPRPKTSYREQYRCAKCRHAWNRTYSEF